MLTHERRFLATLIDILITITLALVVNLFIPRALFTRTFTLIFLYTIVGFIYIVLCLLITKDKTIGIYVMSLKMLGRDWNKVSFKTIVLRGLTHAVPILYLVNIFYMILNKTASTWFDEISDSFVVQTGDNYQVENK